MSIQNKIKLDWYIQGFPAIPLYLNLTGASGFIFKKEAGVFTHFLTRYQNGYGEMGYYNPDFFRLYQLHKAKIFSQPDYLKKQKSKYLQQWKKHVVLFKKISQTDLTKLTDKKIIVFFHESAQAQIYSAGLSHPIIEPVGLAMEKEFKNSLQEKIGPIPEFNKYYAALTAPIKLSWVSQEEAALFRIAKLPAAKKEAALKKHQQKYFWINNCYRQAKKLTLGDLKLRLRKLKGESKYIHNLAPVIKNKQKLIKKLNLDKPLQKQIQAIDFISQWQDERKANIFQAIYFLDLIVSEISRRAKLPKELLLYLGAADVFKIANFRQVKKYKAELQRRKKGVYFYVYGPGKQIVVTGSAYRKMYQAGQKLEKNKNQIEDSFHGSIANPGTAIGRVAICKNISQLSKVKEGNILVASMTRPEYMPALKRAAAIITDEGGITCHAAIVSRELNKPCLIGTKIATKALKDGMLVEVKANHGIVNIL